MVTVEAYPDLGRRRRTSAICAQLEGTENRITVERQRFNEPRGVQHHAR
jgi:LemA protein